MNPSALARACRPRQWTKNLLVFAAPLFAFTVDSDIWFAASGSLVAFCLISSAIYLLNDSIDVEADRRHPRKRYRPIAAGQVSVPLAVTTSALLAVLSLTLAAAVSAPLAGVILSYGLIQVGYCLRFKREPLLDLFCIACGFLLRAMAGGVASKLALSPWFLLTIGLLALFLAVEKRKSELHNTLGRGHATRQVLARYSLPLLLRLESLLSTSTFISYSLWASGPVLNGASTSWMLLTVPFVLAGIFRYELLSDPEEADRRSSLNPDQTSEMPEEILLGDKGVKLILLGWLVTTVVILALSQVSR
jgi:decaprenyl-phosphate phosphoribosyltransferase